MLDSWNEFLLYIFFAQVILILFSLIVIPLNRTYLFIQKKKEAHAEAKISNLIIDCLEGKPQSYPYLEKYAGTKSLLLTLEAFDHRLQGGMWKELKFEIGKKFLLPYAHKKTNSFSWIRRNFAARSFALTPIQEDEVSILKLIKDPVFLVRSVAAIAAIRLEHREGIIQIIRQMSQDEGYAHYFYSDLLLKKSKKTLDIIKELAETDPDPNIHWCCLKLMGNMTIVPLPDFLNKDISSPNPKIRLAATKILARNPQDLCQDLLLKCMEDPDREIRAEAALGLQYFPVEPVIESLDKALKDPEWLVRLHSAQALSKMGEKGVSILKKQIHENYLAYEAAQTVLKKV